MHSLALRAGIRTRRSRRKPFTRCSNVLAASSRRCGTRDTQVSPLHCHAHHSAALRSERATRFPPCLCVSVVALLDALACASCWYCFSTLQALTQASCLEPQVFRTTPITPLRSVLSVPPGFLRVSVSPMKIDRGPVASRGHGQSPWHTRTCLPSRASMPPGSPSFSSSGATHRHDNSVVSFLTLPRCSRSGLARVPRVPCDHSRLTAQGSPLEAHPSMLPRSRSSSPSMSSPS